MTLNSKLLNRWATDCTVKQNSIVLRFPVLGVPQRFFTCRILKPNQKFSIKSSFMWNHVQKCGIFTSGNIISLDTSCHFQINPLNAELNPICHLLALLGVHHFLHVSRIRVKSLTLRLLMSYIYGAPILDVSRSHTTTHHSR